MSIKENVARAKTDFDEVYEAGKKAEYDKFWDAFQHNGSRTLYENAFCDWIGECFEPKYDLIFSEGAYSTSSAFRRASNFDLKAKTIDRGIAFDTSLCSKMNSTFYQSAIGAIPPLDLRNCIDLTSTFNNMQYVNSKYVTREIVLHNLREDCAFNKAFDWSQYIESIVINGTIGQNGFNVQRSTKLSHESLVSIINALKDYSGDTSGTEWVCTLGADNIAKLTNEEQQIAYDKGWNLG